MSKANGVIDSLDDNQKKAFWDHVIDGYNDQPNLRTYALFSCIQSAVDSHDQDVLLADTALVHHMAACGWVILGYNRDQSIPLEDSWHDYILNHVFDGFVRMLVRAVRVGKTYERNGWTLVYGFRIPDWFVEWAKGNDSFDPD